MYSTKNFTAEEFACKHTGEHGIQKHVVDKIQALRDMVGRPLTISSAYRSPTHPIEAKKSTPGTHAQGLAVDIKVSSGAERYELIQCGLLLGATGIGVNKTFIHLDWRKTTPVAWEY